MHDAYMLTRVICIYGNGWMDMRKAESDLNLATEVCMFTGFSLFGSLYKKNKD